MDLCDHCQSCIQVITFWLFDIKIFHLKGSTRNCEDFTVEEIPCKFLSIQCGRCDNLVKIRSPLNKLPKQPKKDLNVDCPLMSFIEHYYQVLGKILVNQDLPK
uniref:Putative pre-mRNA-splicing factor ATP-dependent RNA helicase n=1 Tax=Rhizophora mucronata TaxID=61149 RepID=A0A2P2NKK0_RHIMU